jgi:CRP/FNR family transcriptional regulator, cyclic AMP receptor protein
MASKRPSLFSPKDFLEKVGEGKTVLKVKKNQILFSQGDAADAVFYLQHGKAKLTVVSPKGKEAVIAILEPASFFGEGCLSGQPLRMATAACMEDSALVRIEKSAMIRALHEQPLFSELFMTYLLSRNVRIEEDLVDHLFNSSEKRLARILLLLAHYGKEGENVDILIPKISQETLADMVGTTRSRVSSFMNKFRELGFIEYNGGLKIHSSLLNIVLHD